MPRFRRSIVLKAVRRALRNDQLVLALMAVAVGGCVGAAVVAFREAIALVQWAFFATESERLYRAAAALPWWQVLLAPVLGGLLVGLFVHVALGDAKPAGMGEVIEEAEVHGGHMPLRRGLLVACSAVMSIGAGASVGREGPAVHLGASLGSWFARRMRLPRDLSHTLLGCGAAAAVAASFNAPIAGALFAQEVVAASFAPQAFAPVVIAAVTATAVSRRWFGDFAAFVIPEFPAHTLAEFPAFAVLGVAAAVLAALFVRGVAAAESALSRVTGPPVLRLMLGGGAVGAIAVAFPQVLGGGYELTDDALQGVLPLSLLVALIAAKLAASTVSVAAGFAGGVFGPALALGALLGGAYGLGLDAVFPGAVSPSGAYAMVGMGAVAAAILGAPVSTTLMVFELTADYGITIHTLAAAAVASAVAQRLTGFRSYFHYRLAARQKSRE